MRMISLPEQDGICSIGEHEGYMAEARATLRLADLDMSSTRMVIAVSRGPNQCMNMRSLKVCLAGDGLVPREHKHGVFT